MKMEESKLDSLQMDDKIDLHWKGWHVQTVLLIIIFLFILAAALGLFGDGILGKQTLGEKDAGLWLQYDRFGRKNAPGKLEVHFVNPDESRVQLILPSSYLENFHIEAITPEPNNISSSNNQVVYNFEATGPLTVVFRMKPDAIGKVQGNILVNKQTFSLKHFIYP